MTLEAEGPAGEEGGGYVDSRKGEGRRVAVDDVADERRAILTAAGVVRRFLLYESVGRGSEGRVYEMCLPMRRVEIR